MMSTTKTTTRARTTAWLPAVLMAAGLLSGCGSGSTSSSESNTTTASADAVPSVPFSGNESGRPSSYPTPTVKPGVRFTVGFLSPNASSGFLQEVSKGLQAQTEKYGGKFISYDAGFNLDKQVSQFSDLLAKRPDVIVAFPLVPSALSAQLKQAKAAGIPVIGGDTPADVGDPLLSGFATNVGEGVDLARYSIAKAVAQAAPRSTYALLGVGLPVPVLKFAISRSRFWGDKFGNTFVGEIDATGDTPEGAQQAMTALLAKYPDVDNVIAYNDTAAQAAASVAQASGKTKVRVIGTNGSATAIQLIRNGRMWGTYAPDQRAIGTQMGIAAYNLATKQNLPLPKHVVIKSGTMVTPKNAKAVKPANGA